MTRLNKKAQGSTTLDQLMLVLGLFFMILIAVSIVILVSRFVVTNIDIKEAEGNILLNRFVYSSHCLAYERVDGNIKRVLPGIIDLTRFNENILTNCIYFGTQNDYAAANLTLFLLDTKEKREVLYNRQGYEILLPRVSQNGPGGAKSISDWRYVLVNDNGKNRRGLLQIEVLIPN